MSTVRCRCRAVAQARVARTATAPVDGSEEDAHFAALDDGVGVAVLRHRRLRGNDEEELASVKQSDLPTGAPLSAVSQCQRSRLP